MSIVLKELRWFVFFKVTLILLTYASIIINFYRSPDTPTNVSLYDITTTAVSVSWTAGYDYG